MDAADCDAEQIDFAGILSDIVQLVASNRLIMPGVPEIATRVRQAAADPNGSAAPIAGIIREDPALAAHLIKVSNSVMHRRGQEIRNVHNAVMRLGFKLTAVTATSFCIMQMMAMARGHLERVRELYRHSVAVGERCYMLAERYPHLVPEDALLVGLVHDIGVLPILQYAGARASLRAPEILDELIRSLHASVGATLLNAWHFPPLLVQAVEMHEDWYRGTAIGKPDYADLVIAANLDVYRDTSHPITALAAKPPSAFARLRLAAGIPLSAQWRSTKNAVSVSNLCSLGSVDAEMQPSIH
jgi:HD-like signal output (HDOD) protein